MEIIVIMILNYLKRKHKNLKYVIIMTVKLKKKKINSVKLLKMKFDR